MRSYESFPCNEFSRSPQGKRLLGGKGGAATGEGALAAHGARGMNNPHNKRLKGMENDSENSRNIHRDQRFTVCSQSLMPQPSALAARTPGCAGFRMDPFPAGRRSPTIPKREQAKAFSPKTSTGQRKSNTKVRTLMPQTVRGHMQRTAVKPGLPPKPHTNSVHEQLWGPVTSAQPGSVPAALTFGRAPGRVCRLLRPLSPLPLLRQHGTG